MDRARLDGSSALCCIGWDYSLVLWLGWVRGFRRVSSHCPGILIIFHVTSVSPSGVLSSRDFLPGCALQQDILNVFSAWWLASKSENGSWPGLELAHHCFCHILWSKQVTRSAQIQGKRNTFSSLDGWSSMGVGRVGRD